MIRWSVTLGAGNIKKSSTQVPNAEEIEMYLPVPYEQGEIKELDMNLTWCQETRRGKNE